MKPKNRVFCVRAARPKLLFDSKKKADNFMRYNGDEIADETGKKPVRSYYCTACGGWHVTSREKTLHRQMQERESEYAETTGADNGSEKKHIHKPDVVENPLSIEELIPVVRMLVGMTEECSDDIETAKRLLDSCKALVCLNEKIALTSFDDVSVGAESAWCTDTVCKKICVFLPPVLSDLDRYRNLGAATVHTLIHYLGKLGRDDDKIQMIKKAKFAKHNLQEIKRKTDSELWFLKFKIDSACDFAEKGLMVKACEYVELCKKRLVHIKERGFLSNKISERVVYIENMVNAIERTQKQREMQRHDNMNKHNQ